MACLYIFGFSLNTLSLFALILAIGIVVDDAIVIVENIERMREEKPEMPLSQIIELTLEEVFSAIIAIMLVLSVVFIPVMLMGGLAGLMYKQFAVTIACAVILSGISALTFTPAISLLLLRGKASKPKCLAWFDKFFDKVTNYYVKAATFLINHRNLTIFLWIFVVSTTVTLFKIVPKGFVPPEDQALIFTTVNLSPSSSLNETESRVNTFVAELMKNPNISDIVSISGMDFLDFSSSKTYAATMFVILKDWDKRTAQNGTANDIIREINKKGKEFTGMSVLAFNQPPIRGLSTTGGVEMYLEDKIYGDPHKLQEIGESFIAKLKKHPSVAAATQTLNTNVLEISIKPDVEKATFYHVDLNHLYLAIQTLYSQNYVNYAYIMQDLVWVILEADYPNRSQIKNLSNLYVRSLNDQMVPINSVVNVVNSRDAQVIQRFNNYIATKLTIMPKPGYSAGDVMNTIDDVAKYLPKGYGYEWYGTSYMQKISQKTSSNAFVFSLIMIYLVLAALYERWKLPLVVILGIPCALFGSAIILLLSGNLNDLYFQISLIALLGLSAKNIILLVEFALQHYEKCGDAVESAIFSLRMRFRPIVMTSITFIAGTVPLVIAHGAGANAQHSVGMGIIGGITGSVFIGTLITPAFFVMIMKNKNKHKSFGETHEK